MELLKKEICFLSKNQLYLTKNENSYTKDIILSPYYYWYFQRKLPTSNKKRALKILPQMLSSLLPHQNFKFILKQKDKELYDVFALDMELVKQSLHNKGLDYKLVSNLSFSHTELNDGCFLLNESYLLKNESMVSETKQAINKDLQEHKIEDVIKDIEKLNFKVSSGNSTLLEKSMDFLENNANVFIALFVILIAASITNILSTNSLKSSYDTKKSSLLSNQSYAQHEVQLKYVKESFMEIDFEQKAIRTKLDKLSNIKTNANEYLESLELDNKTWLFSVKAPNKETADTLLGNVKATFLKENKGIFVYESKQ